jgi:hypothetical protein
MIVTDAQVVAAMAFWENAHIAEHGPLDRVTLPGQCSRLAELLGAMWFARESQAQIAEHSAVAQLLLQSGVLAHAPT